MNEFTSVSLLQQIKDHTNIDAWQRFTSLYEKWIRRYLAGRGVRSHDADDVVQEVLAFISREIVGFDHNGRLGAFRNWLRQVTANRLKEFCRKQKQVVSDGPDLEALADELIDEDSGLSRIWQREHDRFVVEQLLEHISDRFRKKSILAFRKIILEGKQAQDVANELNLSVGAVRVAQSRVLRMLQTVGEGLIDDSLPCGD